MNGEKERKYWSWFGRMLVVVVAIMAFNCWITKDGQGVDWGFSSSLFSGLAFAGLIVTLWMQMDELREQGKQGEKRAAQLDRGIKEQERMTKLQAMYSLLVKETAELSRLQAEQLANPKAPGINEKIRKAEEEITNVTASLKEFLIKSQLKEKDPPTPPKSN